MGAFAKWFARWLGGRTERARLALPPPSGHLLGASADGVELRAEAPSAERSNSALITGQSGCGKSQLIASWCAALALGEVTQAAPRRLASGALELDDGERPAIVVLDPKADTIQALLAAVAKHPDVLTSGRIRYISPFAAPFPFNLVHAPRGEVPIDLLARQLALLTGVLTAQTGQRTDGGVGARQIDLLSAVYTQIFRLGERDPRASLLWASDALASQDMMKLLAREATGRTKEMLLTRFPDDLLVSCAARSRLAWGAFGALTHSTGASTCLDVADLTAPGAITLIDLGAPLGGPEIRAFYASVFLRLIVDHLLSRPSPFAGHHCQIVIDEATQVAGVAGGVVESIAQTGRSRRVAVTVLVQGLTAFERAAPGVLSTVVGNVPRVIVGRMGSAEDAELLARGIAPVPGSSENMKTMQLRLAASIANLRSREFVAISAGSRTKFRSADVDVARGEAALARHAETIAALKRRYVLPADGGEPPTLFEALGRPPARQIEALFEAPVERATEEAAAEPTPEPRPSRSRSPKRPTRWG